LVIKDDDVGGKSFGITSGAQSPNVMSEESFMSTNCGRNECDEINNSLRVRDECVSFEYRHAVADVERGGRLHVIGEPYGRIVASTIRKDDCPTARRDVDAGAKRENVDDHNYAARWADGF
jgi:hypothetical protein